MFRNSHGMEVLWQLDGCQSLVFVWRGVFRNWFEPHSRKGWYLGSTCLALNHGTHQKVYRRHLQGTLEEIWTQLLYPLW